MAGVDKMKCDTIGNRPSGSGPWQSVRRLTVGQQGSTFVECAVVVALVSVSVLVAVLGIGSATTQSLDSTAGTLFGTSSAATAGNLPQQEASSSGHVVHSHWPSFVALILATVSLAICGRKIFSRAPRTENKSDEDAEEKQLEDDLDTFLTNRKNAVFQKRQELLRILSSDAGAIFENRLEISQLMSRKMKVVLPNASRQDVVERMEEGRMRHLLVCDIERNLLGIISDRDLMQSDGQSAQELMTPKPVSVEPNCMVNPAITQLIRRQISCLPVVEDGKLCGVVTTTDLMMALQCTLTTLAKLATEIKEVE